MNESKAKTWKALGVSWWLACLGGKTSAVAYAPTGEQAVARLLNEERLCLSAHLAQDLKVANSTWSIYLETQPESQLPMQV